MCFYLYPLPDGSSCALSDNAYIEMTSNSNGNSPFLLLTERLGTDYFFASWLDFPYPNPGFIFLARE